MRNAGKERASKAQHCQNAGTEPEQDGRLVRDVSGFRRLTDEGLQADRKGNCEHQRIAEDRDCR